MPLYMDFHIGLQGVKREDLEHAHQQDIMVQDEFGVKYHKFWVNEEEGTLFCLVEAPSKDACEIIEVHPSDVAVLLGAANTTSSETA